MLTYVTSAEFSAYYRSDGNKRYVGQEFNHVFILFPSITMTFGSFRVLVHGLYYGYSKVNKAIPLNLLPTVSSLIAQQLLSPQFSCCVLALSGVVRLH